MEARGGCRLDVTLLTEEEQGAGRDGGGEAGVEGLADYPINAMRNEALRRARTELVLLLDVDFVVSADAQVGVVDGAEARPLVGGMLGRVHSGKGTTGAIF